jgi:N-acetylmuramoyl-L-alanine amidase
MQFSFREAMAAASSFCAIGVLSTCSPATSAWANDYSSQIKAGLLPAEVIAEAAVEAKTLPGPELADEIEAHIASVRSARVEDMADSPRATSLAALVGRHQATSTSDREAECLAGAVYFESKGEPLDGQLAVAQTILNRAKSGRFPGSICGVVFQPSQFSFVRGGGFPPIARSSQQWKTAVAIGHIAANKMWDSSVDNALFFHARHVSPGWRLKRIAALGNHIFYR